MGRMLALVLALPVAVPGGGRRRRTPRFSSRRSRRPARAVVGTPVNITAAPATTTSRRSRPTARAHPLHLDPRRRRRPTSTATTSRRARRRRVTNTPESEYSPTVTPDGAHISVIRVEADGTQRLWRFTLDGRDAGAGADRRQAGRLSRVGRRRTRSRCSCSARRRRCRSPTRRPGTRRSLVRASTDRFSAIPGGGTISFVQRCRPGAKAARRR